MAALAVLSYTRKDDEFFGGYITGFRKTLENAVHVVTGEEDFRIFQDVEGIVIGEHWQKKLAEVIGGATFFVPMLSPLFFNSAPCRDEMQLFLARERELHRDDLILPVYFLSSVKLEKEEETRKDPLAAELSRRQLYDWRDNANIPLEQPASRAAILRLARGVAAAIERVGAPVAPASPGAPDDKPAPAAALPPAAVAPPSAAPAATEVGGPVQPPRHNVVIDKKFGSPTITKDGVTVAKEVDPIMGIHGHLRREPLAERVVLWVDDNPANNAWERRALESYGVRFVLATSTAQAEALLREGPFDAVISDFSRAGDHQAGFTMIEATRGARPSTPCFIYSGSRAPEHVRAAVARGARGATSDPDELVALVMAAVR